MINGSLVEMTPVKMPRHAHSMARRALDPVGLQRFESVQLNHIVYISAGLKIHGWLAKPTWVTQQTQQPAIVFCRGGAGPRGALSAESAMSTIGHYASWGYTCVASNYRGAGGSDGVEEWGLGDVDDAMACLPLLSAMKDVDTSRVGLIGGSRGGMMAFHMLTRTNEFRAAITFGAPTRINAEPHGAYIRQSMLKHLPAGSIEQIEAEKRSVVLWADKLSKSTPLLLMHGTGDKRVGAEHSLALAMELQKLHHPYKLIMYDNADHVLAGRRTESNADMKWWMDHYVMHGAPLPITGPHGV